MFITIIALVGVGVGWLRVLNRKHATMREQLGKSAKVTDLSMEHTRNLSIEGEAVNSVAGVVGDKAFQDITDLKNEDFIYVY